MSARPAIVAGAFALSLAAGCGLFSPGADVRTATESRQHTLYTGDTFSADEATTHNRRNVLAEGSDVKAEFFPDGTPKAVSGATNLMAQSSEPRDAASAYTMLAQENAKVGAKLVDVVDRFASIVAPRDRVVVAAPEAPEAPAPVDRQDAGPTAGAGSTAGKTAGAAGILAALGAAGIGFWKMARGKKAKTESEKVNT